MFGQTIPGRYVIELSGEPAGRQSARQAVVRSAQIAPRRSVAALGGTVIDSMDKVINALIVEIPAERVAELMQVPDVVKVHVCRNHWHRELDGGSDPVLVRFAGTVTRRRLGVVPRLI